MSNGLSSIPPVLLVEDDHAIREAFAQILEEEGYAVIEAGNGQEALRTLREDAIRPGLILLDLMMPVMNGYEFRAEQLLDPALADIPVVLVSADPTVHRVWASLKVQHILTKPVDVAVLLDTVASFCRGSRERDI